MASARQGVARQRCSPEANTTNLQLEHFFYGKLRPEGAPRWDFRVTAWSRGLTRERAEALHSKASLGSSSNLRSLELLTHGYGIFRGGAGEVLVSHVRPAPVRERGHTYPEYHVAVLRLSEWADSAANLLGLVRCLGADRHAPEFRQEDGNLPPLVWQLERLQDDDVAAAMATIGDEPRLQQLLDALLGDRPVTILGAPGPEMRIALAQALLALLPVPARPAYTFATEVFEGDYCSAHLKLMYRDPFARPGKHDLTISWAAAGRAIQPVAHPYARSAAPFRGPHSPRLQRLRGDMDLRLQPMIASLGARLPVEEATARALAAITLQWEAWEDYQEGRATFDALLAALSAEVPPPPKQRALLEKALAELADRDGRNAELDTRLPALRAELARAASASAMAAPAPAASDKPRARPADKRKVPGAAEATSAPKGNPLVSAAARLSPDQGAVLLWLTRRAIELGHYELLDRSLWKELAKYSRTPKLEAAGHALFATPAELILVERLKPGDALALANWATAIHHPAAEQLCEIADRLVNASRSPKRKPRIVE